MNFIWIIFAIIFNQINCQSDPATVAYYENLINEENARAAVYPLPVDASVFTPNTDEIKVYGNADYIIVGGGSSGSVIASRLSEDENVNILLLEAGGLETAFTDIPGMAFSAMGLEYNWNYNSTPQQKACLGLINKECPCPRGLGLGGSSIINGLIYARGNKVDYDDWRDMGNPGWSYNDVLPFFKKSENSRIPNRDPGYHGTNGYFDVEYSTEQSPQFDAFIKANRELGYKILDYNGREQVGASKVQYNTANGRRLTVAKAFLMPAKHRTNLDISLHSYTIKVLIGRHNKTAYGVVFSKNKQLYVAYANEEVVVSAGVIGSPQLLMLSGIGHRNHLRKHGIRVVQDLDVGDNLQDHQAYFGLSFSSNYMEPVRDFVEYIEQYLNGTGLFTRVGNLQGLGFYRSPYEEREGFPDIELLIVPSNSTSIFVKKGFHLTDSTYEATWGEVDPATAFAIHVVLLHPKSVGNVRLKSDDPYEYPRIDPKFLSDARDEDIKRMRWGIRHAINLVHKTEAFKRLNARLIRAPLPPCKRFTDGSDGYWDCQLRQLVLNDFHPIGTCKMGPDPRKGAVVNHELKVYGVKNLRVADSSIIPKATSGHPGSTAIMIGEKFAHMLKNGH